MGLNDSMTEQAANNIPANLAGANNQTPNHIRGMTNIKFE